MASKITQLKDKQQNDLFPVTESSAVMYKDDITVKPTVEDYSKSLDAIIGDTYIGDIISTTTNLPAKTITEALHQAVTGLKYVKDAPSDNGAVLLNDVVGNTSTGANATASGSGNTASGINSFATGSNNEVLGSNSFVTGSDNEVGGNQDIVGGNGNTITTNNGIVGGTGNTVHGNNAIAGGFDNTINGNGIIFGHANTSAGGYGIVGGENNTLTSTDYDGNSRYGAAVFGQRNTVNSGRNLVGGGYNYANSSNSALVGYYNTIHSAGDVAVFGEQNEVATNNGHLVSGYKNTVNYSSTATTPDEQTDGGATFGRFNSVLGRACIVGGSNNTVNNSYCVVGGSLNVVKTLNSNVNAYTAAVFGQRNTVYSNAALVQGCYNISHAKQGANCLGYGLNNTSQNCLVVGDWNRDMVGLSGDGTVNLDQWRFVVGGGKNESNKATLFGVTKNGDVIVARDLYVARNAYIGNSSTEGGLFYKHYHSSVPSTNDPESHYKPTGDWWSTTVF